MARPKDKGLGFRAHSKHRACCCRFPHGAVCFPAPPQPRQPRASKLLPCVPIKRPRMLVLLVITVYPLVSLIRRAATCLFVLWRVLRALDNVRSPRLQSAVE